MGKPLMQIDQPSLQVEINSYRVGWNMVWATMFPLKYTQKFDIHGLVGNDGIPVAADKVAFNSKAPQKGRKTVGSWSGTLGKISVSREKNEMEINEYNDALVLAAKNEDAAAARDLVNSVYDDVQFAHDALDARLEIDGCEIACSGIATKASVQDGDNTTADIIDFNIPEKQKVGVKKPWSSLGDGGAIVPNADADGIGNIIAGYKLVKKAGKLAPKYVYIHADAFELMQAQPATATRLFPNVSNPAMITAEQLTLEGINAYMRRNGYPELLVIDPLINEEDKNGNIKPVNPYNVNVLCFSVSPQLGWTYYKTVPKVQGTDNIESYGAYYKITVAGYTDPMLEKTIGEAYVQQGLINRGSMVLMNVNANKWNNGAR